MFKKKVFHEEYEKVEVPKEDVLKAIQMGIKQAVPTRKKQLPFEKVKTDEVSENEEGSAIIKFNSIIEGQSSTTINYSVVFLKGTEKDQIRMDDVYDDQGNPVHVSSHGNISKGTMKEGNHVTKKGRAIIPMALAEKTSYLEIHPKLAIYEPNQFLELNEKTPVDVHSKRQELSVKVEKMIVQDKKFIVDFQMNMGGKGNEQ
ncbi:hypothetical protein ACQKKK_24830 [Peribacillus sp. NPDC006672]|uniref:hypothetical protein n=1 Tax=Peribacillus sp. NPDC006672 TaxID=3390606 RepID=UPI003CFC2EB8